MRFVARIERQQNPGLAKHLPKTDGRLLPDFRFHSIRATTLRPLSVGFDTGELYDLRPLLGIVGNELGEVRGGA
jgi:hypothetical protein